MSKHLVHLYLCIIAIGASLFAVTALADDSDIKWSYQGKTGPKYWGQLSPEFALCANGKQQSPIDINEETSFSGVKLNMHYKAAPMMIVEDGLTELTIGDKQTIIHDGHSIQLNFPSESINEILTLNDTNYRLIQFHIHTPSENKWRGKQFPLEIHFVHQGNDGTVAVIGVFAKLGKANPALQKIIDHIPHEIGQEIRVPATRINPASFLPIKKSYYYFLGSLTTPPCTEGLRWVVMDEPITASPEQIRKLKQALSEPNSRPVQPLNDREVNYFDMSSTHE